MLQSREFWLGIFYASEWVLRLVMLVIVPVRRSPATAKTWLLLILIHPYIGLLLFLIFGRRSLPRWRVERHKQLRELFAPVRERLANHPHIIHPKMGDLDQAVLLAKNLGQLPILGGNDVELLSDYDGIFARLVADIDSAAHHVHLLYYIFADDEATQPVIDALKRATQRGVKCRVLVDAVGSRAFLRGLLPQLAGAGAEVHQLLSVGLFRRKSGRYDLRNHRKIAVIDGRVGYTGSQNLIRAQFKEGIIYDELVTRVTGPLVLELQLVFVADWFLETGEALTSAEEFPEPDLCGSVPCQILPSGPGYPTENNQRLFVALIHAARKRVVITTPYFIPDEPLFQAMQTAVLRGVEVHLIVSEKADQLLVSLAQKSYYSDLLAANVQVHLFKHNFLHAKHLSIDNSIILIGSSNMDIRSFALNAEISALVYDEGVNALLQTEEQRNLENCMLLDQEQWEQRSLTSKAAQSIARLFSPLL